MSSSLEDDLIDGAGDGLTPLGGLVVLDLSSTVSGQYAGRMLALQGADVVLVEPPGGTPTRRRGPAVGSADSFLFQHLNQGKRSFAYDPDVAGADDELRALVGRADVLIRNAGSAKPEGSTPHLVDCVVADAPAEGPYGDWKFTEMIHQALSGAMATTGLLGREPIYGLGERGSYAAGTTAYISIVAALHERRRSGLGQRVDASIFESLAAMGQNLVSQYTYNTTYETRRRYPGFLAMLRCEDAWVVLFMIRNWPTVCEVLECEYLLDDARFETTAGRLEHWEEIVGVLQQQARHRQADDIVEGCQRGRVSAEKVSSLESLVRSEQWRVRGMASWVGDGDTRQPTLAAPFVIDGERVVMGRPSPARTTHEAGARW